MMRMFGEFGSVQFSGTKAHSHVKDHVRNTISIYNTNKRYYAIGIRNMIVHKQPEESCFGGTGEAADWTGGERFGTESRHASAQREQSTFKRADDGVRFLIFTISSRRLWSDMFDVGRDVDVLPELLISCGNVVLTVCGSRTGTKAETDGQRRRRGTLNNTTRVPFEPRTILSIFSREGINGRGCEVREKWPRVAGGVQKFH